MKKELLATAAAAALTLGAFAGAVSAAGEKPVWAGYSVKINEKNFPDKILREAVSSYDANGDGYLDHVELNEANDLNFSGSDLASLEGIEYLHRLAFLDCSGCMNLKKVDIRNLIHLEQATFTQAGISEIDVSGCDNLVRAVEDGDKEENGLYDRYYYVRANGKTFKEVFLDVNPGLKVTASKTVKEGIRINDPTEFPDPVFREFIKKNFDADKDGFLAEDERAAVTSINIPASKKLDYEDSIVSLKGIEVFKNVKTISIPRHRIDFIPDLDLPYLETLKLGTNCIETISLYSFPNLKVLDLNDNRLSSVKLSSLKELRECDVSNNEIKEIDVRKNTKLTSLNVYDCGLGSIDVSANAGLTSLTVSTNSISMLDLSNNRYLKFLSCYNNPLKELDITKNPELQKAYANTGSVKQDNLYLNDYVSYSGGKATELDVDKDDVIVTGLCKIDASANPSRGGTVKGGGLYKDGAPVTLEASANKGYVFVNWTVDKSEVSKDAKVTFKCTGDAPYVANFVTVTPTPKPTKAPTAVPTKPATSTPVPTVTKAPSVTPKATVTAAPVTVTPKPAEDPIRGFIDRIYEYVLEREPDEEGASFWVDSLRRFDMTGAQVGLNFVLSDEFTSRGKTDDEFVTILYKTFFGREPEEEGFKFWTSALADKTMDRAAVANGFVNSLEWANICAESGIRSGGAVKPSVVIEPSDATYAFVERMYTTAMERESDEEGAKFWTQGLANFEYTGEQVGVMFFLSDEMKGFNLSDSEFVTRLYKTFMDREPEEGGFEFWVKYLSDGGSRSDVVYGFTRSEEFVNKCIEARILPY